MPSNSLKLEVRFLPSDKDAAENIDCESREDGPGNPNPQTILVGQHFVAAFLFASSCGRRHFVIGRRRFLDTLACADSPEWHCNLANLLRVI